MPFPRKQVMTVLMTLGCLLLMHGWWAGPAGAFLTLEEERKLGKEFYDRIEKTQVVIRDARLNRYLTRLGEQVLAQSQKVPFSFRFTLLKNSAINAFATPGGYVYINTGLIDLINRESELAGVLAHEIAHVNARHIAQSIEKAQQLNIASLAAVLAAALIGGGGELTAAAASFSTALAVSASLKYSREQEEEADRLGLFYMTRAGYDGESMPDFLRLMKQYEFYSNSIPSYFLTHPGTDERIRYLDGMLQTTHKGGGAHDQVGNLKRMKTRVLVDDKSPEVALRTFQTNLARQADSVDDLYGLALVYEKMGKIDAAREAFERALALAPDDPDILRDTGLFYFRGNQPSPAVLLLARAHAAEPEDTDILLQLGKCREALGQYPAALDAYRKLEIQRGNDPEVLYALAMTYGKMQATGESHDYFGRYFKGRNKPDSALYHFRAALNYLPQDSPRARQITEEINALKRKP